MERTVEGSQRNVAAKPATVPMLFCRSALDKRKDKAAAGTHRLCYSEVVGKLPERHHHKRPTVRCFLGKKVE